MIHASTLLTSHSLYLYVYFFSFSLTILTHNHHHYRLAGAASAPSSSSILPNRRHFACLFIHQTNTTARFKLLAPLFLLLCQFYHQTKMASFITRACFLPTMSITNSNPKKARSQTLDAYYIKRAVELADKSAGYSSPHPNFGCVIEAGRVVGEGYLYAQGTTPAELQAIEAAGAWCRGATAYLNMEPGDCHGEHTAVSAIVQAGVKRVVIGIRHPLKHLRGSAIQAMRSEGVEVDVLGKLAPTHKTTTFFKASQGLLGPQRHSLGPP